MTSTGVSSSQWSTCLISFGASRSTMVWRRRASIGMASSRTPPRVRDVTRFGGTNRLRSRTSYTFAPERLTAFPLRSRRVVGRLGLSDDMIVFLPEVAECSVCMSFPHDRISCGLPGGSRCARAKDRPVLLSIFVRLRVWPERHRAQSCAIALRSPARLRDKIRLLGFTTLHDSRRYAIPRCLDPSHPDTKGTV